MVDLLLKYKVIEIALRRRQIKSNAMGLIKPASAEPLPTKPYDSIFKKITLCGDWARGRKMARHSCQRRAALLAINYFNCYK
jgi:hypothetical protein